MPLTGHSPRMTGVTTVYCSLIDRPVVSSPTFQYDLEKSMDTSLFLSDRIKPRVATLKV